MEDLGYLGPPGTHSEAAAQYLLRQLGEKKKLIAFSEIYRELEAVSEGEMDACLVPVENALEGGIAVTLDALAHREGLKVWREIIWPVHHQLLVKDSSVPIQTIFSHAQPLAQCQSFLRHRYPAAVLTAVSSTAQAAELVAKGNAAAGWAAIGTRRAAQLYGLRTAAEEIQDQEGNCTRFFEIHHEVPPRGHGPQEKSLIICQLDGRYAGSLCAVLQEFAHRGVNLTRIESRPSRTGLGVYIFFFELEIPPDRKAFSEALTAVEKHCIWLKNLGEFPVLWAEETLK